LFWSHSFIQGENMIAQSKETQHDGRYW
jgi:hypothetical protein